MWTENLQGLLWKSRSYWKNNWATSSCEICLRAMLYTVRSGCFFDLCHVLPFTLLHIIVICTAVVLRDLGQKKASPLTYTEQKNRTLKKGYGTRASRTMPSWKSPISGCPEKGSSLLWITCVYPPLSEHLLTQEQSCCCCEQTKVVLGFWPEATCFRRKVWPRAETVAVTFTHLQTENTPYFPISLHHRKITLETLKWIKSNFLPLPLN